MDKRFNPNGRKYQIQTMWEVHHEICRLAILGTRQVDIARLLGITEATVSTCLNSEVVKHQLHVMRMARDAGAIDIAKRLEAMAPKATQILEGVLNGEEEGASPRLKVDVAKDVLDRVGHGAPKLVRGEIAHAFLTVQDIEDIKRKAKENKCLADAVNVEVIA